MKEIASAFVKAQSDFKPALKSSTNPYFKRKYADLSSCLEAVLKSLNSNGIAVIQPTYDHADGVMVETLFLHTSGETLSGGKLFMPAVKGEPQAFGSALTYARRYSLMSACCIAGEDDDAESAKRKPPAVLKGEDHDWQITVQADPQASPEDWVKMVSEFTVSGLGFCSNVEEVMTLFRVNRNIFDQLKNIDGDMYKNLMQQFTNVKNVLKEKK